MIAWLRRYWPLLAVVAISIASWLFVMHLGAINAYNDARSHLNIARLVVDSRQTGIAQLGAVWLPLSHVLTLPFIWNDWAWQSGFAGSIVSMVSFVATAVAIYYIVLEITKRRMAGLVAGAATALNLNLLYMQATPLTEPLFLATLTLATLFTIRYITRRTASALVLAALFAALQIMARYDGWFATAAQFGVLLYAMLTHHKLAWREAAGRLVVFVLPIVFAVGLWLLWNAVLFGNPLYSFFGPNSAHAQQQVTASAGQLTTLHNWGRSAHVFGSVVMSNVGAIIVGLGALGWIFALLRRGSRHLAVAMGAILLSVGIFNVLALYLGFSTIEIPSAASPLDWFNTRYGITMLPFFTVGLGLLVAWWRSRVVAGLAALAIATQIVLTMHGGVITYLDGTRGVSATAYRQAAVYLHDHVAANDVVVMSFAQYSPLAHQSGLDLDHYIQEGDSREWNDAVGHPQRHARWIVMARYDTGDPLHSELVNRQYNYFLRDYRLVEQANRISIYERR